ncbi:MAG: YdeI/OmpD-associated family protein, partial [Bdellovibrionaceae bacterium]|nr:YdeI/OmpD-associated family protein [Pseudobdellovibrionaceae bacterium]
MSEVLFIQDVKAFNQWFAKNYKKSSEQWFGFYKKSSGRQGLSSSEAMDVAICYGWSSVVVKRIDYWSYQMKFMKRKDGSSWGPVFIKRYNELLKNKKVKPAGVHAFESRNKKAHDPRLDKLTAKHEAQFKKSKVGWAFFKAQTASYQKYMCQWVNGAKREETQKARLAELIQDSTEQTKLKRVVQATEKTKPKYAEGQTPVEEGRNLGPATGMELRSVEIMTLEQLKRVGWERAIAKVCRLYPHRINLNYFYSVVG